MSGKPTWLPAVGGLRNRFRVVPHVPCIFLQSMVPWTKQIPVDLFIVQKKTPPGSGSLNIGENDISQSLDVGYS